MKSRAQRRADTERVRKNRIEKLECMWERDLSKKEKGRLRKSNGSCGCGMCKPWKHTGNNRSWSERMKHSDRKKALDE